MYNSKLIRTLSSLDKKEFKQFEKRIINSVHKNDNHILFINFLVKEFPIFSKDKITKKKIFSYIYKKEKYSDIRIREFMSGTFKFLKEFLVLLETTSSNFYCELSLLKQYNSRNLNTLYSTQLKIVKNILKKDKYENKEHYRRKYLLAIEEDKHFSKKGIRVLDENIQVKLDNLDYYYISTKIQESCDMLNRQRVINQKYDFNLFSEIETIIDTNKDNYLNKASIVCYYEIYKLIQTKDDEVQLKKCVNILIKNSHNFSDHEIRTMLNFPQNYCIGLINKGNFRYTKLLFELQRTIIDEKFILVNGFISEISYRNIVSIAIKLKEFEWAEKFNENYKEKVSTKQRENSYNMNKAHLYFSQKNYDKTVKLLNQIEFSDSFYATYSKIILLKTYYASKEFETLSYFITSFKLYLKRNKELNPVFKKNTDIFLSYFKKIFIIAEKIDFLETEKVHLKLNELFGSIKNEKSILNRSWLIEIIDELRK